MPTDARKNWRDRQRRLRARAKAADKVDYGLDNDDESDPDDFIDDSDEYVPSNSDDYDSDLD